MKKTNKKKKNINKKGFSKAEFMIMLCALAILLAIGSKYALDNSKNYSAFKSLANKFGSAVARYKDQVLIPKNEYFLYEVEKNTDINELTSPFDKNVICDKYESSVILKEDDSKEIKLVCGDYVVEAIQSKSYKIYEVSEWTEESSEELNDGDVLYNYKENGNLVLSEYMTSKAFVQYINSVKGLNIDSVNDIKSDNRELVSKIVYRSKKLVKEY